MKSLCVTAMLALALTVSAHHSTAHVDMSKLVEVRGVMTGFQLVNPHSQVQLTATDKDGKPVAWSFETHPPAWFRKAGIRQADFRKGLDQTVTVSMNPARDGSPFGYLLKITFADGTSIGFE